MIDINGQFTAELRKRDSQNRKTVERELALTKQVKALTEQLNEEKQSRSEIESALMERIMELESHMTSERGIQRGKILWHCSTLTVDLLSQETSLLSNGYNNEGCDHPTLSRR